MKKCYVFKTFKENTLAIIQRANEIIDSYREMGYQLTIRQLFYQFVSRDILPNTDKSYDLISSTISNARLAGLVDWNAIQDRTRFSRSLSHWTSPEEIVRAAVNGYKRNHWEGQPCYVEVWVEKDALIDVVQQACQSLDVSCFSCRGYVSQTAMWEASLRFIQHRNSDCKLFHLGDHDPSGIDMTRDIGDRLHTFNARVDVKRIALNMDQVKQYGPPPNPAKLTDSRCADYIEQYGEESWELDALEPPVLVELINTAVEGVLNRKIQKKVLAREKMELEKLEEAADRLREEME